MTEETKVIAPRAVKRLTLASLVGKVANIKKKTDLAEIAYHVNAITTTENPDDPGATILNLSGEFHGTNLETGDIQTAGQATFPSILSKPIQEAKGELAANITGRSIIGVEPKEGGGMKFYVKHVTDPKRRPVLDLLADHVAMEATRAKEAAA